MVRIILTSPTMLSYSYYGELFWWNSGKLTRMKASVVITLIVQKCQ